MAKLEALDPAFPIHGFSRDAGGAYSGTVVAHPGMTLRDWFAGQALSGIISNPRILERYGLTPGEVSKDAYLFADAMLIARGVVKHG